MSAGTLDVEVPEETGFEAEGFFAMIPEWVGDSWISDRALRLYYVLRRMADRNQTNGRRFYARRRDLASSLRCSESSLDRAVKELVVLGALHVQRHYLPERKQWLPSTYLIRYSRPAEVGGCPTGDATPPLPPVTPPPPTDGTAPFTGDDAKKRYRGERSSSENTARGNAESEPPEGAVASDRARASETEDSAPQPFEPAVELTRAKPKPPVPEPKPELFESEGSTADAVANPPPSARPPRAAPAGRDDPDFVTFWGMAPGWAPHHAVRKDAYAAWRQARKETTAGVLLTTFEAYTAEWATWGEEDRDFIPAETTWLAKKRWLKPVRKRSARPSLVPSAAGGRGKQTAADVAREYLRNRNGGGAPPVEGRVVEPSTHTPDRRVS